VAATLARGGPVVALESLLICHGMPHPTNLATATALEAAVRAAGAVLATIVLFGGTPTVKVDAPGLVHLAVHGPRTCKVGRRGIAAAAAAGDDGATTVSATAAIALMAQNEGVAERLAVTCAVARHGEGGGRGDPRPLPAAAMARPLRLPAATPPPPAGGGGDTPAPRLVVVSSIAHNVNATAGGDGGAAAAAVPGTSNPGVVHPPTVGGVAHNIALAVARNALLPADEVLLVALTGPPPPFLPTVGLQAPPRLRRGGRCPAFPPPPCARRALGGRKGGAYSWLC